MKKKIYLTCFPAPNWGPNDVIGQALCEDGAGLASHLSSNISFSKHDMGLTSDWKHKTYKEHCPDGFDLEWVDDPENHDGWQSALVKNKQLYEEKRAAEASAPPPN